MFRVFNFHVAGEFEESKSLLEITKHLLEGKQAFENSNTYLSIHRGVRKLCIIIPICCFVLVPK